jgi:uncharacterized circularly permuted ATP-grasp superfamily protein
MGDLFDGYGSTLAPRKTVSGVAAFDEMFAAPASAGAAATSRPAYRELYQALAKMTQDELRGRTESLASSYLAQGVTFDFAGEERPFPLDAVPRVIRYDEWSNIEKGVQQRVRALEAFLDDAYGHQHCVRDGVLPAALIASSSTSTARPPASTRPTACASRWPASTSSATRTARCGSWRTTCGCRPASATSSPTVG